MKDVDTPLVSVVIIAYNSSAFILEALESVKRQTWPKIELIISDDCSMDNTVCICEKWIKENTSRFAKTEIITTDKNGGIASNCNRGILAANGDWFKLIGADDILLNTCIADNLSYAENHPDALFIISDMQVIDSDSRMLKVSGMQDKKMELYFKGKSAKEQLKAYTRWPAFINTPTFFYKKEIVDIVGHFDEKFKIYEDMSMIYKTINSGVKLHYFNIPTVQYRVHDNSISHSQEQAIEEKREEEALEIFRKYRRKNLCIYNPIDLAVFYESWLRFKYKGIKGHKGISILIKFSLFYWYLRFKGIRA